MGKMSVFCVMWLVCGSQYLPKVLQVRITKSVMVAQGSLLHVGSEVTLVWSDPTLELL